MGAPFGLGAHLHESVAHNGFISVTRFFHILVILRFISLVTMEATTDDISHQAHDRGSPAVRAAKDITFGSVRPINVIQLHNSTKFISKIGRWNSFENF
jgi:hypothetical protein